MLKKLDRVIINIKQRKRVVGIAIIAAVAVLTATLLLIAIAPPGSKVVAIVNGEAITTGEVTKLRAKAYESYRTQMSDEEALEQLIAEALLYQEAEQQGYALSMNEAEQELEARMTSANKTMEDLTEELAKFGFSYEEYLQDLQRQLSINSYLNYTIQVPEVTKLEAMMFYEDYKQQHPGVDYPPFEQLESRIIALLKQQKQQNAINLLIDELKDKADIQYK